MFTGIVEAIGVVTDLTHEGSNLHITLGCPFVKELRMDQSVSHNGVCLTVVKTDAETYTVTAVEETLQRTNLGRLQKGSAVNLERCMPANGRFDGHIVQGHVDTTAQVSNIEERQGSWNFCFDLAEPHHALVVEKGSISVNGVSLTVVDVKPTSFSVITIPYTMQHTNFLNLSVGDAVNIEFDILGKYVQAMVKERQTISAG